MQYGAESQSVPLDELFHDELATVSGRVTDKRGIKPVILVGVGVIGVVAAIAAIAYTRRHIASLP